MSSREKYGKFKKKDYLRILYGVREYLCEKFGYKIKPRLLETRLVEGAIMEFIHGIPGYAIFYDYKQFKDMFGHGDYETQAVCAAAILAHEIRHYYQHRQMIAAKPRESEKTIALWLQNERDLECLGENGKGSDYYLQPMELDAFLFEYLFAAEEFEILLIHAIANEEHLNAMEQLYIEYAGKTDSALFGEQIRIALKLRDNSNVVKSKIENL